MVFAGRSTSFWIDTVFVVCALNTTTVNCKNVGVQMQSLSFYLRGFRKELQ